MFVFLLYLTLFSKSIYTEEDDDFDTNRLATAPRLGTTMRTAATTDPRGRKTAGARPRTTTGRALTGMVNRDKILKQIHPS